MTLSSDRAREIGKLGIKNSKLRKSNDKLKRIIEYNKNPSICKNCKIILSYDHKYDKFCSHKCSAIFNNLGKISNNSNPIKNCNRCGKKLSMRNIDFCFKCLNLNKIEKRIENGGFIHSMALRKYYIDIRGHLCEECKNTTWNNKKISIHCHHIDGNTDNNKSYNIKLLCPNCHSQTDNYCSGNRGDGKYKIIRIKR